MRCNSAIGVSKCQKVYVNSAKRRRRKGKAPCIWTLPVLGTSNPEPTNLERWILRLCTPALHSCEGRSSQVLELALLIVNCVPFGSNELALLIVNVFGRRFASFCEGKHRIFLHVWRPKRFKSLNSETQLTNSQSTNPDSLPRDQSFWFILLCLAKLCTLLSKHLHF